MSGADNVPLTGPVIVAISHKSDLDPIFAGISLRRQMRFMAKIELFAVPLLGRLIKALGAFPVDRGAGDRSALETSLQILASGEPLLMFPEGHRYRDEALHPFLPGVGMIAMRSGAVVIPAALTGTNHIVRHGRPGLPVVRMTIGRPVNLTGLEGRKSAVYAQASARIREAVLDLYEQSR
ncbi:MAG: lysophospholipid acyltransferase family protein [Thermoleophilia bacterium]